MKRFSEEKNDFSTLTMPYHYLNMYIKASNKANVDESGRVMDRFIKTLK